MCQFPEQFRIFVVFVKHAIKGMINSVGMKSGHSRTQGWVPTQVTLGGRDLWGSSVNVGMALEWMEGRH